MFYIIVRQSNWSLFYSIHLVYIWQRRNYYKILVKLKINSCKRFHQEYSTLRTNFKHIDIPVYLTFITSDHKNGLIVFEDYFVTLHNYYWWYSKPSHSRNGITSVQYLIQCIDTVFFYCNFFFLRKFLYYLRYWQRIKEGV